MDPFMNQGDQLGQGWTVEVENFGGKFLVEKTRPNCDRMVREMILFNVLCTVYCGRGCVSLESEWGKEWRMSRLVTYGHTYIHTCEYRAGILWDYVHRIRNNLFQTWEARSSNAEEGVSFSKVNFRWTRYPHSLQWIWWMKIKLLSCRQTCTNIPNQYKPEC